MKAEGDFTQMVSSDWSSPLETADIFRDPQSRQGVGGGAQMGEDRKGLFVQIDSS